MSNSTFVRSLGYLRRRVEFYLGRRLPLPALSPIPPFASFAAQPSDEFRAIYRGESL